LDHEKCLSPVIENELLRQALRREPSREELLRLLGLLANNCWPFDDDGNPISEESDDAYVGMAEAHEWADAVLLAFVNDVEVTAAYIAVEKWYR
jgi:hypothetical protein